MTSFPFYKQLDTMDCGPACLKSIAKFYGKSYSLQMLRERCHISNEGVTLSCLCTAAESIGFRTVCVKINWNIFRDEIPLPCIVHWQQAHFVVVHGIKQKKGKYHILVSDPTIGLLKYSERDFLKGWGNEYGIALILEPTQNFYKKEDEGEQRLSFFYLFKYLIPYKKEIIIILFAMFIASVISFIFPFITQSVVDKGIVSNNLSLVVMLLIAQLFLTLGQMVNNIIRSRLMLKVTANVSITFISNFLSKLMRLPIAFFESKRIGDLMQRIEDYNRIQSFMAGTVLSIAIAVASLIVYSIVMAKYNLTILSVFLIGSILYILWVTIFLNKREKLDYMQFEIASTDQSNIVQLLNGMKDIKLNNCEKRKQYEWKRIQQRMLQISMKSLSLSQVQDVGATFIDQTKNIVISFIAAKSVMQGDITIGMMMSLQYIMGQLNAPIQQCISFITSTQNALLSLKRLNEIQVIKDEEFNLNKKIEEIPPNASIEFKNVSFQYNEYDSLNVLRNVSFQIPNNKVTAIVGGSGSGKTTILKMILGFYQPTKGKILLDYNDLNNYSKNSWRNCCGTVMQDGYIFSDSIAGNIGMSDTFLDIKRVRLAAKVAVIDDWINSLPLGYNTKIGPDGHDLSAGQKQRILIARAVYKNARYLFFDEATNSLDAYNEKIIMHNLDSFFCNKTVVIVAHRLSTIFNADNIIVLDNGEIVEQGTHQELINNRGRYFDLIKNQLDTKNII